MSRAHVCDHSNCPAEALHEVTIYGQDLHFCHHHWVEFADVLPDHLDPWRPHTQPGPPGRGREPAPTGPARDP